MELSKRLQAVADLVTPGLRIADIGTDHAYVPVYLLSEGKNPSGIAMDINVGPLERARKHIGELLTDGELKTRLKYRRSRVCGDCGHGRRSRDKDSLREP